MKFHTEYLTFHTRQRREYINITGQVQKALAESGIREGIALVSAMHITAAVYVNDAGEGLIQDIDEWLERLAPYRRDYRHHRTGEDNGDAHLKNLLIPPPGAAARHRGQAEPWGLGSRSTTPSSMASGASG